MAALAATGPRGDTLYAEVFEEENALDKLRGSPAFSVPTFIVATQSGFDDTGARRDIGAQ